MTDIERENMAAVFGQIARKATRAAKGLRSPVSKWSASRAKEAAVDINVFMVEVIKTLKHLEGW